MIDTELDSSVDAGWVVAVLWEQPPVCQIDPEMASQHRNTGSMEDPDFIFVPHVPSFRGHFCRIGSSSRSHQMGDSDNWSLIGERASARSSSSSLRMMPGSVTDTVPSLQLTRLGSAPFSNSASGRGRTWGYNFDGSNPTCLNASALNKIPVCVRKHCLIIHRRGIRDSACRVPFLTAPPPTSGGPSLSQYITRRQYRQMVYAPQ